MRARQRVSEACQINDLDHKVTRIATQSCVSEACQINDLDHPRSVIIASHHVSEACQINDLDHCPVRAGITGRCFRSLSDQ